MYTGLSNKKVYPYLSSIFEVDGIKYVPVSPSERTCDAIDCTYTGDELKINKKVNYKGVDMTVREINPYTAYSANIKKVYIENGFTTIGVGAFSSCRSLTSVTIPNSVTTIEYGAFSGCSSLTSVIIPNSVKTIGAWAFGRCMSLTSVTIPNSVKTIERFSFYNCKSLTSVTIPNSVTTIEQSAFSECRSLNSVAIPNSVTKIENGAFSSCSSLTSVIIPNSVTTIGGLAFSRCTNLQKVNIGNSVKTIGKYAFNNCTSITQISSEAVVPPTCESGVFTDINKSKCKLIVPKNSLDAYKQADQWKDFLLIEGSTTGITNTVYNKAGLADVYTIDGTRRLSKASTDEINALPKGVYIVNGKKIIIK
ncbi:MAG: leucine-rich repeat domain-containing protein [Prevotella sp.]|nr:leucine-rich repeat domain-containing protein [Prevotella sp.]